MELFSFARYSANRSMPFRLSIPYVADQPFMALLFPALWKTTRSLAAIKSYIVDGLKDPVIGRKNEMERVIQILCRRTKNNPVLLGGHRQYRVECFRFFCFAFKPNRPFQSFAECVSR
jgi:hypothetical protein